MTVAVGGERARFIQDGVRATIVDILTQLGHLATAGGKVHVEPGPIDPQTEIPFNTLGFELGDLPDDDEMEVGSNLTKHTWTAYVDFFAENPTISLQVMLDLRDALAGKRASIGYSTEFLPVYDPTTDPPTQLFTVEVVRLESHRQHGDSTKPWQANWSVLIIEFEDVYADESG